MPELPEVETTARQLQPELAGRAVTGVRVYWKRSLGVTPTREFSRLLVGARIARAHRRGKHVILDLTRAGRPAGHLAIHLRMTGRLIVAPAGAASRPWTRVALQLDDSRTLLFVDVRKFGRMFFWPRLDGLASRLGPEPLEAAFSVTWLREALRRRRRRLKPLLLDQAFIAGLGNIYVDESLHRARLHPESRSDAATDSQASALWRAIRKVLQGAIQHEGSSFDAFYRTPEGQPGRYQRRFLVYGRTGLPCRSCGTKIVRLLVGQRATHICPQCQRAPR